MSVFKQVTLMLLMPMMLFGDDKEEIENTFNNYIKAFFQADFDKASKYIAPMDVENCKVLLPVFMKAIKHDDPSLRKLASAFFGDIEVESRKDFTGFQCYVGMNRMIKAGMEDAFNMFSDSSVTITDVFTKSKDSVAVHYNIIVRGKNLGGDFERLIRINGKWYLKLKQDPQQLANKLRSVL